MWKVTGTHVVGTSHVKNDLPCQDYCGYQRAFVGSYPVVIIAIADGAGSARLSHIGAQATVENLLRIIPTSLTTIFEANLTFAVHVLNMTRRYLKGVAIDSDCALQDLACTTLFAVLGTFASFFAHIGDGGWVIEKDGNYMVPMWPEGGEYVNETTFLTSSNWEGAVRSHLAFGGITAVAGFTDGLQRVALQIGDKSAFAPFFDPLFDVLRQTDDETSLISPLKRFLCSEELAARTDDDKTLVLACHQQSLLLSN
jgi:Protein phosphatase 2C